MMTDNPHENRKNLRVIKTARTLRAINRAAKQGFIPLVKPVVPSKEISSVFRVLQNRFTREVVVDGDFRSCYDEELWEVAIDWTEHYPYSFPHPFAAYLIPPDIKVGERVWLDDLIQDYVGSNWNQGSCFRLEAWEAVWDGNDFVIDYDPDKDAQFIVG